MPENFAALKNYLEIHFTQRRAELGSMKRTNHETYVLPLVHLNIKSIRFYWQKQLMKRICNKTHRMSTTNVICERSLFFWQSLFYWYWLIKSIVIFSFFGRTRNEYGFPIRIWCDCAAAPILCMQFLHHSKRLEMDFYFNSIRMGKWNKETKKCTNCCFMQTRFAHKNAMKVAILVSFDMFADV